MTGAPAAGWPRLVEPVLRRPTAAAVAGALCIAFSAVLYRLAATSPSTGAVLRCGLALPFLLVAARLEAQGRPPVPMRDRAVAWLAGLFFAADLILWHHAIDDVGAGLATVLGNAQVALVPLAAWLAFGERPPVRALSAVPFAATGVILISGVVGARGYGSDPLRGTVFGALTAVAYTGFLLCLRHRGRSGRIAATLLDATAGATLFAAAAGALIGELDLQPRWPAWGWLLLLAVQSQALGWLLISVSFPRLPVALTSVLLTVQPAASMVLAAAMFAESPSALQLVGAVVLVTGVVVATSRSRRSVPVAPDVPVAEPEPAGSQVRLRA